jgi:hypothetical protein
VQISLLKIDKMTEELLKKLPTSFTYDIPENGFNQTENGFKATIRCNIENDEDILRWISEYEKLSWTSWILGKKCYNFKDKKQPRLRFRKDFLCRLTNYRHVVSNGPRCLARNCDASIIIKVKNDSDKSKRTDPYVKVR